ncbi:MULTISPECIES: alkaline phosphatase family protein [Acidobacterium]|nr:MULTISPECIES: alkaline phosphatase family protein [Acidobacterium]HCT61422.1 phosphoesterase [Acidobacterium sp.]
MIREAGGAVKKVRVQGGFKGLAMLAGAMLLSSGATCFAGARPALPQTEQQIIANLRAHVHHVFVVYQENRSFDSYFGSFPGVDNLATAEARAHGFRQWDAIGHQWITPFLMHASDTADADHSRLALLTKTDHGKMDKYVSFEEENLVNVSMASPQYAEQVGMLTMGHEDCTTIPFLWMYAHHFTIYDHIFQAMDGPSTPGNIELIAAQTGQTEAARHPERAFKSIFGTGDPVVNDANPAFGPYAFPYQADGALQIDQTYATLMLTLKGREATEAKVDSDDIKEDVSELARLNHNAVPWGWYQEGFGDGKGNHHPAYIPHHNSPQYFGYIRKNPKMWMGEHDLLDFFTVIEKHELPEKSVSIIKGGYKNPFGWKPANPAAANILGDDDHPGYSDSQLSESLVAKVVNAVAHSPYWKSSAIIVLWDDSEGFYDHVPPPQFEECPDKEPCGDGPRVPLILISPYARSGGVDSNSGDQGSFAKFLDVLFRLPALGSLPDEKPYLPEGPRDTNPRLSNLLGGFDPARLAGEKALIPPSEAEIPATVVNHFPPSMTCKDTGVAPVAIPGGSLTPPKGFTNPIP